MSANSVPLSKDQYFFKATSIHWSIVAILEFIRGAQCFIEVIWSSGEEMWCVDAYQIPYYSRGIEEAKRTHPRFADWLSPCPFSIVRFEVHVRHVIFMEYVKIQTYNFVVRDSSAVRRHFLLLLELWDVRELYIRKTVDLPLQLLVSTFPRFVAIGFYFLSETLI